MRTNKLPFKILVLMTIIVVMSLRTKAQTYRGCVLYRAGGTPILSDYMYTSSTGRLIRERGGSVMEYNEDPKTQPLNALCYTPVIPNVPVSSLRTTKFCRIGTRIGVIRTITVVPCPIDSYTGYLLLSLSVVGVCFIRKQI